MEPYPHWHCVLIEDQGPDGWPVRCVPHGPLGVYAEHLEAFRVALEHDAAHHGRSWR